jgi:hypothetical protein
MDDPLTESRGWGDFRTRPVRLWGPPSLLHSGCRFSFPGVEWCGAWCWPSTPRLASRLKRRRAIPLLSLWTFMACSRVDFYFGWKYFRHCVRLNTFAFLFRGDLVRSTNISVDWKCSDMMWPSMEKWWNKLGHKILSVADLEYCTGSLGEFTL